MTRALRTLCLLASASLLALAGCSNDPSAPADDDGTTGGTGEVVVGPAGGSLRSADGRATVTVPSGALAEETALRLAPTPEGEVAERFPGRTVDAAYRLEPSNVTFAAPIEITIATDPVDFTLGSELDVAAQTVLVNGGPAAGRRTWENGVVEAVESTITIDAVVGTKVIEAEIETGGDVAVATVETTRYRATLQAPSSVRKFIGEDFWLLVQGGVADRRAQYSFVHEAVSSGLSYDGPDLASLGPSLDDRVGVYRCLEAGSKSASYFITMYPEIDGGARVEPLPKLRFRVKTNCDCAVRSDEDWDERPSPVTRPEGLARWKEDDDDRVASGTSTVAIAGTGGVKLFDLLSGTEVQTIVPFGNYYGVARFSPPAGLPEDPARDFGVLAYGPTGTAMRFWVPEIHDFGMTEIGFGNTTDATNLDGVSGSTGVVVTNFDHRTIGIQEFDPTGAYVIDRSLNFLGVTDRPISAVALSRPEAARRPGGDMLVATIPADPTLPGSLVLGETSTGARSVVGALGVEPRRVRMAGELVVVSNFGSDNLTLARWSASGAVTMLGEVTVGDGPIGIDVVELESGSFVIVSTGYNDDTYTLTRVTIDGAVLSNDTRPAPATCDNPGHAIFVEDTELRVIMTCNGSDTIVRLAVAP